MPSRSPDPTAHPHVDPATSGDHKRINVAGKVRDGRLVRNVAEGVPLPRVVATPKRFLTHDQVQALAEACAPYDTLIRVLAYAGLRWGELVALTACRIDLARRRIEVVEAITEVHSQVLVGTTKTHQRRSVPIPHFLADDLADHLTGKAPGDLVFTAPEGGVLRNTNFRPRFFDPAAGKVGLLGLTPHELRHTAEPCHSRRRQRQSGAADARARLSRHDPRHLCGPLRR
jgi:integrase